MIGPSPHEDPGSPVTARIGALVDRQHELLLRLDEMSRRQMGLIEEDRAERLLELIGERQHVIDQLQKAAALLEPLRAEWSETVATLPGPAQESVRRRLDTVSMLIDQINARDDEARRRLAQRRDEIAVELLNVGRGRGAVAAYAGAGLSRGATFQDREG
jgi:hypothetical protein